ncbi:hypothetical protein [Flavobacterium okayamense]|uniref:Lipocalin-like domain-containing protein n=1 Tax=Flavobacterium okayamense TaxID=2830782 RepID=A0ABM7S4T8_9FLAO|nr:hypothetical protein [Flavobacterium okayamense]BCY28521.1 hypothetical protein KK2020170_13890 [Flavobacterium okayamense]
MKTIYIYLILLFTSFKLSGQSLENSIWQINDVFGNNGEYLDEYQLTKVEKQDERISFVYGNSITFYQTSFSSNYSAPCGNDCFPSSSGNYKIISNNQIETTQFTFDQSGDCETIHKKMKIKTLYQIVQKSKSNIILKKINQR